MVHEFYNIGVYWALALVFGICCLVSFVGFACSWRYIDRVDNKEIVNKMVWQTILFFSTLFITFWIATNWNCIGALKLVQQKEANKLEYVYLNLDELSVKEKFSVEDNLKGYINSVINVEYPLLSNDQVSNETQVKFNQLNYNILHMNTNKFTVQDRLYYAKILDYLSELSDYRELRLSYLSGNLYGPLLYFFLGMILLGCFWTGFVNTKSIIFSLIIICSQNLIMASSTWIILEMDKPFTGYFSVNADAFVNALYSIDSIKDKE